MTDRTFRGDIGAAGVGARGGLRLLALALLLAAAPAAAQEAGSTQAQFGQLSYRLFCAGCHGPGGKGDGAVAQALEAPATDLTQLARENGGIFPADEVADAITGLSEVGGHRDLAMAPWAAMFAEEFESFAERAVADELVARRIAHLVAYLESIQEE